MQSRNDGDSSGWHLLPPLPPSHKELKCQQDEVLQVNNKSDWSNDEGLHLQQWNADQNLSFVGLLKELQPAKEIAMNVPSQRAVN